METNNIKELISSDDYSWFKVHLKNIKRESQVLFAGIVKNFRRVSWHNKKNLTNEYVQVIGVIFFLAVFFYVIYKFISLIQQ